MNVVESWVRVADYRVPLIGGEAACVFVDPGEYNVVITSVSIDPLKPNSKKTDACKSPVVQLRVEAKEDRVFSIWPATKRDEFVCGWRMESRNPAKDKRK
jgi:hypothetical protein